MLKLDRIDRHILELMQENGRISNLELAELVGLSPSPCSRRVKALEDAGLIDTHVTLLECDLITGNDADYQLKVVVRDMEHYQHFLLDKLTHIPGVTGVRSSFVLRRIKHKTALPLNHLG